MSGYDISMDTRTAARAKKYHPYPAIRMVLVCATGLRITDLFADPESPWEAAVLAFDHAIITQLIRFIFLT